MQYRNFGTTGIKVSEIGLGCWQLGGADWGAVSAADALAILHRASEVGINFFDTADVYGLGRSERLIGQFIKETSVPVFVATKIGRFPKPGGDANFSLATFTEHVDACLGRLGLEVLDLVQLHCIPSSILYRGEVFEWLRILQKEGKIRYWGVSVESMEEGKFCLAQEGLTSLQIIFNIFRQKPVTTLLEQAQAQRVALIARIPLASGLLTGKFDRNTVFAPEDHRSYNRDGQLFNVGETFVGLPFTTGVELVEELKTLIPEDLTLTALRWCLDYPAITTVIPGAKNPDQVAQNAQASDRPPLSPELHQALRQFYQTKVAQNIRGPY